MVLELLLGQMEIDILVIGKKIKDMDKVLFLLQTVLFMTENIKMGKNTGKVL